MSLNPVGTIPNLIAHAAQLKGINQITTLGGMLTKPLIPQLAQLPPSLLPINPIIARVFEGLAELHTEVQGARRGRSHRPHHRAGSRERSHHPRRARGRQRTRARSRAASCNLRQLLQGFEGRLRPRLCEMAPRQQQAVGQAAGERYGEGLGDQIRALLGSDMPFDKLLMMVGAVLSDHYEDKVRDTMGKIAANNDSGNGAGTGTSASGTSGTGAGTSTSGTSNTSASGTSKMSSGFGGFIKKLGAIVKGAIPIVASVVGGPVAGMAAGAVVNGIGGFAGGGGQTGGPMAGLAGGAMAGLAGGAETNGTNGAAGGSGQAGGGNAQTSDEAKKRKDAQLQGELQYYTQKMKQSMEMITTLLRLSHDTSMAAVNQLKRL